MSDISIERGAFPQARGYQASAAIGGGASWAPPASAPGPEEGGGEIYDTTPVNRPPNMQEIRMPTPFQELAPPGPPPQARDKLDLLLGEIDFVAFTPSGVLGQFMRHPLLLTDMEAYEVRRLLAGAVARQLDEERARVVESVQPLQAGAGSAGPDAGSSVPGVQEGAVPSPAGGASG